jgi:hypothetical protein
LKRLRNRTKASRVPSGENAASPPPKEPAGIDVRRVGSPPSVGIRAIFHRDMTSQSRVPRAIHFSHAARAKADLRSHKVQEASRPQRAYRSRAIMVSNHITGR